MKLKLHLIHIGIFLRLDKKKWRDIKKDKIYKKGFLK
jgi:hypothetical protein